MDKNIKEHLEETERLKKENKELQQQLKKAVESIDAIKKGNIDAVVIADEEAFKVFTDKTADKIYRVLIEKMNEGAVTLNEDGTILYCNTYFANMVSLPLQKIIGSIFKNYIDDSSKELFADLLKQAGKNAAKKEVCIQTNDGKVIPVLMSLNTLNLNSDIVLSIILTDLTIQNENQEKLKRRSRQLEQKNKELERANKKLAIQNIEKEKRAAELLIANIELAFQNEEKKKRARELYIANTDVSELQQLNAHKEKILAILSHDLRSPLTGIIGASEHLKSNFDKMEFDELKKMLDLLHTTSKEELNMLDYLVEWARIKYASETFSPTNINLAENVRRVFNTLNEVAAINTIKLHNEIADNTSVFADEKMLLSVLQNLISNAIKHSHPKGKITVTAKSKQEQIIVEIKDTGLGMSKEIKETLFTPQMNSLSNARKDNKGAGIGLLLAKGFLEKNGGEIWAESVEGEGSSFYFTLPLNNPLDKIIM